MIAPYSQKPSERFHGVVFSLFPKIPSENSGKLTRELAPNSRLPMRAGLLVPKQLQTVLLYQHQLETGESTGQMDQNLKTKFVSFCTKWGDNLLVSHWFEIIERRNELLFVGFHFSIPTAYDCV